MQCCNDAGRQLIESFEGFYPLPYQCPSGVWTQGYGHTDGVTYASPPATLSQADAWLADDLGVAEGAVNSKVVVPLTSNQFSALVSFVFNIGAGAFATSGVLKVINLGRLCDAPAHMMLWNRDRYHTVLDGLTRRRAAEVALFGTPDPSPV